MPKKVFETMVIHILGYVKYNVDMYWINTEKKLNICNVYKTLSLHKKLDSEENALFEEIERLTEKLEKTF